MGLAFQPESKQQLAARFTQSLSKIFDAEKISNGSNDRPGTHRENVFDYEDGIRLIISKDRVCGYLFLHVSGSTHKKPMDVQNMVEEMIFRLVELAEDKPLSGQINVTTTTKKGVTHITLPLGPEWLSKLPTTKSKRKSKRKS